MKGILIVKKNSEKKQMGKRSTADISLAYFEPCGHDKTPTANLVVRNNIISTMFNDAQYVHFGLDGKRLYVCFDNDPCGWKMHCSKTPTNYYASIPLFEKEFHDWIISYGGDFAIKYDRVEKEYYIEGK